MKRVNQFERTDRDITNALLSVMERKSFESFIFIGHSEIHFAAHLKVLVVIAELSGRDGVLAVEHIIVTAAIADLRLVGNTFIKSFDDAPHPVRA